MKVAFVVNGFPSVSETFIAIQINELVKSGVNITIFNIGKIGELSWLPNGCESLVDNVSVLNLQQEVLYKNTFMKLGAIFLRFPIVALKICLGKGVSWGRLHTLNEMYFLTRMLKNHIVHFQFLTHADIYLRHFKLGVSAGDTKILCSVRGFDITKKPYCDQLDWDLIFSKCSKFLPVCNFLGKKILERKQSAEYTCIPSPIIQIEEPGATLSNHSLERTLTIISVGRLVEKKGLHVALKALALCKQKGMNFRYTIVGSGAMDEELKKLTQKLDLEFEVEFTGALPSKRTIELINKHDILLVPSVTASDGDCEGIPNVIKEGIMLKKLVIASNHAGIPEILTDGITGFLFKEGLENDLCECIYRAMDNKRFWSKVIENAYINVLPKYTPEVNAKLLLNVYNELVS